MVATLERTVSCPHCGAERRVRCGQGTRLRCECGRYYRAPAAVTAGVELDDQPAPPAADVAGAPVANGAGGVTVKPVATPKIRQTARPRARGDAEPAEGRSVTPPVDEPPDPAGPPSRQARAQVVGRRGGAAFYKDRVGRGHRS